MTITSWRKSSHSAYNGSCIEVGSWRTSGYSAANGNCLEAATYRVSSHCTNGSCVEAGTCSHGVAVRDTQDRGGPVLTFGAAAWSRFLAETKAGLPRR